MAKRNVATKSQPPTTHGGSRAKKLSAEQELRRTVMSCLLWEDTYYESGEKITDRIKGLVARCDPEEVRNIAIEARTQMNLRHIPLLVVSEMSKNDKTKHLVAETLEKVVCRPDEMTEFLHMCFDGNDRKRTRSAIPAQAKKGLARAFTKFDAYQLAKWNRDDPIKLRDVMFLTHPTPKDNEQAATWEKLVNGTLPAPDTWEVALSAGADKGETFTRLLTQGKLGYLATLKNLRNMVHSGVDKNLIQKTLVEHRGRSKVLPIRFISAAEHAPELKSVIEQGMLSALRAREKLPGKTVIVVDVSGSMWSKLSKQSTRSRKDAAFTMAMMTCEVCEEVKLYVTGNYTVGVNGTPHGFAVFDAMKNAGRAAGGNGIFLVKTMDALHNAEGNADRVIVITDEQDVAGGRPEQADAFGRRNYIMNVASYEHGIAYTDKWVHVHGFSDKVIDYITEYEKVF